jgi:hypothetical protein
LGIFVLWRRDKVVTGFKIRTAPAKALWCCILSRCSGCRSNKSLVKRLSERGFYRA